MKTLAIILMAIIIAIILIFFKADKIGEWNRLSLGDIILPVDTLAKWQALLDAPPEIHYDTIYQDTGSIQIVYNDLPIPKIDSSRYSLTDSIKTDLFSAKHSMGFVIRNGIDSVLHNGWEYIELGPKEIVKTVTEYVPKPMPYEVQIPVEGIYGGFYSSVSAFSFDYGLTVGTLKGKFQYNGYIGQQRLFIDEKSLFIGGGIQWKIKN